MFAWTDLRRKVMFLYKVHLHYNVYCCFQLTFILLIKIKPLMFQIFTFFFKTVFIIYHAANINPF